ncbi:MAG: hypothetical protein IPP72_11345 [Chitinophagaceae bacterium]|nr:hypothetical protein [Chitinophagaceae bacterium]
MKKLTLLPSLFFCFISICFSQPCIVSADSLKGQYTGDCKNEKADGHGIAIGVDTFIGDFKKGYPEGEGKYAWKNGNWYEGTFRNGSPDGKGTLHKLSDHKQGSDSAIILTGFWKKGKYIGKYEKPYIVEALTNNVSSVGIRKVNGTEAEITITVKSITGGAVSLAAPLLPKSRLTDIQLVEGRFQQQVNDESSSLMANKYIFRGVTFPFFAIFSFETNEKTTTEKIKVEINESAAWGIQVSIDN